MRHPMHPITGSPRSLSARTLLAAALLLPAACIGQLEGPGGGADDDEGGVDDGGGLTPSDSTDLGRPMLRRLTSIQLRNSLVAIFQDPNVPDGDVLVDPVVEGFRVDATEAVIRDLDTQQLQTYAETVADWAVTQKLGQLAPCDATQADCRRQLVVDLGRRVQRQPLSDASIEAYAALIDAEATFEDGARAMIAAMLQSPMFLYRREIGEPDPDAPGERRLTPYELASNLSFMLTDRPPDEALMTAAAEGRLTGVADLEREAERLLATPEAAETLGQFTRGWLETDDLESLAKSDPTNQLTDEVRRAMLAETDALFVDVVRSGGGVPELIRARYTFVNQTLAGYYGLGGVGGDQPQRVELPDGSRPSGILGHGSVLTRHALADSSSPVQRGKLVRERFLCEDILPPPPNVNPTLGDPMGAVTTRERYEQHAVDPICRSCHDKMDPIGFAFEHYDGFARPRDQENGAPIDATGALAGMPEGDIPLDGVESLTTYLADSPAVEECLVRYLSYYSYGLDGCNQDAIRGDVEQAGSSLKSMLLAIIRAPQFSRRAAD